MLGGRSWRMVIAEVREPANYRALARMPLVYVRPLVYMRRYFLGGGSYPAPCPLRSPHGRIAPILYSHHDVFTVNEVFCRRDYALPRGAEVVVDIGSNIGISALYFLTRSPRVRCYLFEPDPLNAERLVGNLAGFEGRYELQTAAVGDREEIVQFGREGTGRYGGIGIATHDRFAVQCLDVNTVIKRVLEGEPRIDMLKLDTEGMETKTVAAIEPALLAQIGVIVFETRQPMNPAVDQFELRFANETCRLTSTSSCWRS
jgi:FkbM family methyltransferase